MCVPTLIRRLAERVDMRRLDDAGAALDDACGLAEVSLGVLVAAEVLTRTGADGLTGRIGYLRSASCQPLKTMRKMYGHTKFAVIGSTAATAVGLATPG